MQKFTVHWSVVSEGEQVLFAIWPSPVSDDLCFREAGFTDFGDGDEKWDNHASGLLSRLLDELKTFGLPLLVSDPVERYVPMLQRFLGRRAEPLTLREEIEARTISDEFPDCVVQFGDCGASLRTGNGHHLFWIAMPGTGVVRFIANLPRIAGEHPLLRTDLNWECLAHQK